MRHTTYTESPYARDLVKIMQVGRGPFTRKMLAEELSKLRPKLYWQELKWEVGRALLLDKLSKANRFRLVRQGWYDIDRGLANII